MGTTFQKRQKEMKRLDKQRMKAERRAQKKREGQNPNLPDSDIVQQDVAEESEQSPSPLAVTGESHD